MKEIRLIAYIENSFPFSFAPSALLSSLMCLSGVVELSPRSCPWPRTARREIGLSSSHESSDEDWPSSPHASFSDKLSPEAEPSMVNGKCRGGERL